MLGIENILYICISSEKTHILEMIINNIEKLKVISEILLNIALGVGAFKGIRYLKNFQEKKEAAIFTFWLQLKIRMLEIKGWLDTDKKILNYLFDEDSRSTWESESSELPHRLEAFKRLIAETLQYIKNTPDQMPVYDGWIEDYTKFIIFLEDILQYDICNGKDYFKFSGTKSISDRNNYCDDICRILNRMSTEIEEKQKKIEKKIAHKD